MNTTEIFLFVIALASTIAAVGVVFAAVSWKRTSAEAQQLLHWANGMRPELEGSIRESRETIQEAKKVLGNLSDTTGNVRDLSKEFKDQTMPLIRKIEKIDHSLKNVSALITGAKVAFSTYRDFFRDNGSSETNLRKETIHE